MVWRWRCGAALGDGGEEQYGQKEDVSGGGDTSALYFGVRPEGVRVPSPQAHFVAPRCSSVGGRGARGEKVITPGGGGVQGLQI